MQLALWGKKFVPFGLVSEEIFPKMSFFFSKRAAEKLFFQKIKKFHLVVWIHMNVGSFDSLQSHK